MASGDDFFTIFREWAMIVTHRSNRGHFHYARENGLSRSMLGTLFRLYHKKNVSVTGLSDHLGVSSAAASQMLERLVEDGLIQRVEDPDDRRMKKITLTERGDRVVKGLIQAQTSWIKDLAKEFTADERSQIIAAMQLMIEKTKNMPIGGHDITGIKGEEPRCGDC